MPVAGAAQRGRDEPQRRVDVVAVACGALAVLDDARRRRLGEALGEIQAVISRAGDREVFDERWQREAVSGAVQRGAQQHVADQAAARSAIQRVIRTVVVRRIVGAGGGGLRRPPCPRDV